MRWYIDCSVFHSGATASSAYPGVDPYSGYATAPYAYPQAAAAAAPPTTAGQTAYPPSYSSTPTAAGYPYDARRSTPPTTPTTAHYAPYDYASGTIQFD